MKYPVYGTARIKARDKRERLINAHQLGGVPGHRWVHGCQSCANEINYGISGMVYPTEFQRRMRRHPFGR